MSKRVVLVYGVGINDADYVVQIKKQTSERTASGKIKQITVWRCPFYDKWCSVLLRCYSSKFHKKQPTYKGCTVSEEWKLFSNFRAWMVKQDWEGKEIDKDFLVTDNKVYSKDTCIFITQQVNTFIIDCGKVRGEWPVGVNKVVSSSGTVKFAARCSNPFTKEREWLGRYACPQEAHKAWLKRKLELAYELAAIQTDPRVATALIERYTNYQSDREKED